jgi:hypothetical protein
VGGLEFGTTGPMFPVGGERLSQIELGNAPLKLYLVLTLAAVSFSFFVLGSLNE